MSYRTSLGKYIDSTALIALPALTRVLNRDRTPETSSISCTEDQCVFGNAMMSIELEVSIEKKIVFLKILQLFF